MSSDLIRTIKKLVLEAGIPNFGGKLGAAVKSNPPPQGGAVFGGGINADAGRLSTQSQNPRAPNYHNPNVAPKPQTTVAPSSSISAPKTATTQSQNPRAPNYHNPNVAPKPQTTVAPATQTQPTTTSAPKQTSTAPKPSTSMPKPKSTVKPVDKKPISSKPIKRISKPVKRPGKWGFGGGSGSQDAGSITNRALGAVNETTKLIETIKTLTKKKNCKGESPKGPPDEVIINPESGLLPP